MDAKITKNRLSRMLSYDWIKIVLFCVVAILVWSLVFTMTATRITPAQQFTVFNYAGNITLGAKFNDSYSKILGKDVFSYEVMEINTNDLSVNKDYLNTLLETRFATSEGDVLYVSMEKDESAEYLDENGEKQYLSYHQSFLNRWYYNVERLDGENGYFAQMEEYLNAFYKDGYENAGSLDEALVKSTFRARIKANKDKRFKTESQIIQGEKDEVARIIKYRDALVAFDSYIDEGYVSFTESTVTLSYMESVQEITGVFSINLCPNVETMGDLQNYVGYYKSYEDANGETKHKVTAENMQIVILDMEELDPIFKYESLLYINSVIQDYCTELHK